MIVVGEGHLAGCIVRSEIVSWGIWSVCVYLLDQVGPQKIAFVMVVAMIVPPY